MLKDAMDLVRAVKLGLPPDSTKCACQVRLAVTFRSERWGVHGRDLDQVRNDLDQALPVAGYILLNSLLKFAVHSRLTSPETVILGI
jgi:hypothetical protein